MNIFWFRRDLRIEDNVGLFHAFNDVNKVLPIFIFDVAELQYELRIFGATDSHK